MGTEAEEPHTEEMLEQNLEWKSSVVGVPHCVRQTAKDFFHILENKMDQKLSSLPGAEKLSGISWEPTLRQK